MSGLLVIEQSSTLSNLLVRTLRAGGFPGTALTHDFNEGCRLIASDQDYEAIIVGVPPRVADSIKPLLKTLQEDSARTVPMIMVIHDKHPVLERWAENRGNCEIVPWQRFSRIPGLLKNQMPEPEPEHSENFQPDTRGVRILFIDDSQSARYAYRQLLESRGFPVEVAVNVREAEKKAKEGHFDLIIVDYYLPDGTGDQLCRTLSEAPETRDATLAIITGTYKESIIKACLDAGAVECMFKNEAKELFLARVSSIARGIETKRYVESERQRLDGILGSVGDGVYGVDGKGDITFINQTGVNILGYSGDQSLIGRSVLEAVHYDGKDDEVSTDEALSRCYNTGDALTGHETVFSHRTGRPLPVECTVFPLSIDNERQGSVVVFRDISERKSVEKLRWEVSHDALTGLANRRHFTQNLERELERLRDDGGYHALLYLDIDRFGEMVENSGEGEGDRILAEVSSRLGSRLRDKDLLARLEGDKFALLLSDIQLPNLFTIADAFRSVLGETDYDFHGITRPVAGSIGVVILSRATPSAEYAMEHARVACATAKKRGRNQTYIYVSEEDTRTARELESGWEERFKDAVRNDRFVFLAQPIVSSDCIPAGWTVPDNGQELTLPRPVEGKKGELIFELLLRMLAKDGQWISPSVFVPLAERVNMVQEMDLWVIRNAIKRLAGLEHPEYDLSLTVNLSNVTLQDPDSLQVIRDVIEASGVNPNRLVFEVTETAEIASLHSARKFMVELKKLGCRFALDDFGTGFSSFSHLKHLPVDFIKIDGMFVQAISNNRIDRTMVNSIVAMAHSLGLKTIAEHVDSTATLEAAQATGVDYIQGHFFGEPMLLDNLDLEEMFD